MYVDVEANDNINESFSMLYRDISKSREVYCIKYNMIKNIQASDWSSWENIEDQQSFDEIIGNKINADYKTIYIGVSFYFPLKKR